MRCGEIEILLAEYVEGTLRGEPKAAVEQHLASCSACAELARDSAEAVAFMERAAVVEPPAELVNRLLFEISEGKSHAVIKPPLSRRWFGKWAEPLLQPRLAMGMAMTMLSLAMLFRFAGIQERRLKPADLDPVMVWAAVEDRAARVWARGVKYYQNLRVVYEIQSRIQEWTEEQPAGQTQPAPAGKGEAK
jgi:anti-sigma factor RsiW